MIRGLEIIRKCMKVQVIIALVITTVLLFPVSAGSIEIKGFEINPQTLLVGDIAECKLTLYNPGSQSVRVIFVQFTVPPGLSIKPNFINVGHIAKQSSYELPFYIEAKKSGRFTIVAEVYTENESVTQRMNVFVEDRMPTISFTGEIKLNEVNTMNIEITSPLEISSVVIEPLFPAEPNSIFIDEVKHSATKAIKFYGEKREYKFKVSFYNGNNFHSFIKGTQPEYISSKGLFVNTSIPFTSAYLYDAIPITVELSNLREDTVYDVSINVSSQMGKFSENSINIAELKPGESKTVKLFYSPIEGGNDVVNFKITYKDDMNNIYQVSETKTIKVLNQPALSITNVETKMEEVGTSSPLSKSPFRGGEVKSRSIKVSISGDVSNNGMSEALNVYVYIYLGGKETDYFIGNIDLSDFQSFSLPATGSEKKAKITVKWTNKIGEQFKITKEFYVTQSRGATSQKSSPWVYVAEVIGMVAIVVTPTIYYWRRRKR